jgi:hypothetical protein
MNIAANIVRVIHILVVLFIVLTPFSISLFPAGSLIPGLLLMIEVIVLPFLILHWVLNDSTCCLTVLESHLRGIPMEKTFMHSILDPVYRLIFSKDHIDNTTLSYIILFVTICLWIKSLHALKTMQWKPFYEMLDVFKEFAGGLQPHSHA